jgi:hypothetical protein
VLVGRSSSPPHQIARSLARLCPSYDLSV